VREEGGVGTGEVGKSALAAFPYKAGYHWIVQFLKKSWKSGLFGGEVPFLYIVGLFKVYFVVWICPYLCFTTEIPGC
jgi:hypothetical protein